MPDLLTKLRRHVAERGTLPVGAQIRLLDYVERLERIISQTAGLRRNAERNADLLELADIVAGDQPPRRAARMVRAVLEDEADLTPEIRAIVDRLRAPDRAPPGSDEMLANIIGEMRLCNKHQAKVSVLRPDTAAGVR